MWVSVDRAYRCLQLSHRDHMGVGVDKWGGWFPSLIYIYILILI